jgi:hypothetical protein
LALEEQIQRTTSFVKKKSEVYDFHELPKDIQGSSKQRDNTTTSGTTLQKVPKILETF